MFNIPFNYAVEDTIKAILVDKMALPVTSEISVILKNNETKELFVGMDITHWSLIIAIAAFLISFAVFWITKKHNQLSVKPLFLFRINTDRHTGKIKIFIMNKGLGPCIINDFVYYYNDKKLETMYELFKEINTKFKPKLKRDFFTIHTTVYPLKNYALTPDENKNLLHIEHKEPNESIYNAYLEEVKKVLFKYKITDYYNHVSVDDFNFDRDFFSKKHSSIYLNDSQFIKKSIKEFRKNRKNRKKKS